MKDRFTRVVLFGLVLLLIAGLLGACAVGGAQTQASTAPATEGRAKFITISPEKAHTLIQEHKNDPNFVILDIRTPQEFESGHIAGAINIDFYAPDFPQQLDKLDKNKVYVVYCRSGNRSSKTIPLMKKLGFKMVYEIQGGIKNWAARGLPLAR